MTSCEEENNLTPDGGKGKVSNIDINGVYSEQVTSDIRDLERIFNAYVDNNTEIKLNQSTLSIFQRERKPNLKTSFDLTEINRFEYNYVKENPDWPHQVIVSCGQEENCMEGNLYYNSKKDATREYYNSEVYPFSNKAESLKAIEILKRLKENVKG